jgi:hypothetical protein
MSKQLALVFSLVATFGCASLARGQTNGTVGVVLNSDAPNPFGNYLNEILKTEGYRGLQIEHLDELTLAGLQSCNTIVLSDTSLTASQADLFRDYVYGGGTLVAMRPDSKLDDVFGLVRAAGTLSEGQMRVLSNTPMAPGLQTATSMKMHGESDL